jgi:hypothetical protein
LTENKSVRINKGDKEKALATGRDAGDPSSFVRLSSFQKLYQAKQVESRDRSLSYSEKLRKHPSLVVYYDFQRRKDMPTTLKSVGYLGEGQLDGVIEGATWTAGRIPGRDALYFNGSESCVKVDIPRVMGQFTLASWVAVESIDSKSSAGLLMSNGWGQRGQSESECHWQILPDGELSLSIFGGGIVNSRPEYLWKEWGKDCWHHVATVVDVQVGEGTLFLDGRMVAKGRLSNKVISLGSARIGNWVPVKGDIPRPFAGRMDEFVILCRALSPQEIAEMYEVGRP